MSTRLALTVVGTVVGAYFGYPQLGAMAGAMIGSAVDPTTIQGPRISEMRAQTVAEGVPRAVFFGTFPCTGNVLQTEARPRIIETSTRQGKGGTKVKSEKALRTYAIGICEGVATVLVVKQDNKIVYDMRIGSQMIAESQRWASNKIFYTGAEDQLPDPHLEALDADAPAHRGTCYMVAVDDDVTLMSGAISQFEFICAREVTTALGGSTIGPTNPGYATDINVDSNGNMLMLRDQAGGSPDYGVGAPGSFTVATYQKSSINTAIGTEVIANAGDSLGPGFDQRMGIIAINGSATNNYAVGGGGLGTNATMTRLLHNGAVTAYLVDEAAVPNWNTSDAANGTPPLVGGGVFFYENFVFMGMNRTTTNKLYKWATLMVGNSVPPLSYLVDPFGGGNAFLLHVSRAGNVRLMRNDASSIREYDIDLNFIGTLAVPTLSGSTGNIAAFAFDEDKGMQAYLHMPTTSTLALSVFDLSGNAIEFYPLGSVTPHGERDGKIIFTDDNIFAKRGSETYSIEAPRTYGGLDVLLSDIVDWLHRRCNFPASKYDTSELVDLIKGFGMASSGYTAADAIDSLRMGYNFDKSVRDKKAYYPNRGKASAKTLSFADLTTIPDKNRREQTQEIPYRLNAGYINPDSGYSRLTESAGSTSPDRRTTGEVTLDFPVVLSADQAAQMADRAYKTLLAEIDGTLELSIMLSSGLDLAEADPFAYSSLDGSLSRYRIEQMEFDNFALKITAKADRQSAYTSNVTGLAPPTPTLPPSTIVGPTVLAVIDGPARTDSEDKIGYTVAVTGALPPWYAAQVQRSLDTGASYTAAADIEGAAIMGVLLEDIAACTPFYKDTTNVVSVMPYRSGQTLDSLTALQFLQEQGVFALENADGSYEYMQALSWSVELDGSLTGTTLHRGIAHSGGTAHTAGAKFVWLSDAVYVDASSSWIGMALTHRAVSYDETEDETTNDQTQTYVGRSQNEWAPAMLRLTRDGSDNITAAWVGCARFGSSLNPVQSANFTGYRITFDDGTTSVSFETTASSYSYDASAMGPSVTVSVAALNRITGAGPATTESV